MDRKLNKYRVHNIKWDTDGDEELAATLPKEMIVEGEVGMDVDEVIDNASDITGFCIISADVDAVKTNKRTTFTKKEQEQEVRILTEWLNRNALHPSYVTFVGDELKVGFSCSLGSPLGLDGREWMKKIIKVADFVIGNFTFNSYTGDDKKMVHNFGKLHHDRPRKYEDYEGNVMIKTEFRCAVK